MSRGYRFNDVTDAKHYMTCPFPLYQGVYINCYERSRILKVVLIIYILNATLLLLHEIESGYEKEWEILKLPCKLTGFLILHIPITILLFYGLLELYKQTQVGLILGVITGFGGMVPFLVHKILFYRKEHFNLLISNIIIYINALTGIGTIIFSIIYIT